MRRMPLLSYLHIAAAETILDDAAIAIAGAVIMVFFLVQSHKNQIVAARKNARLSSPR